MENDRPVIPDIEITPAMTDAGVILIENFSECMSAGQLANQVFQCMLDKAKHPD